MKSTSLSKTGISLLLPAFFISVCFPITSLATNQDVLTHHQECKEAYAKEFDKCSQISDDVEASKCFDENARELDRCRDPRRIQIFVQDKAWREKNAKELSNLSAALEEADDKCKDAAKTGLEKCKKSKSDKKERTCAISVGKKEESCLMKAEKAFLAKWKKLEPPNRALVNAGLSELKSCHNRFRKNRQRCQGRTAEKCANKLFKTFIKCAKAATQNATFKKGHSYKTLSASLENVAAAYKEDIRGCNRKANKFENDARDKAQKEGKDLKTENKRIKQETHDVLDNCLKTGNAQFTNAINAQIMQHFEN